MHNIASGRDTSPIVISGNERRYKREFWTSESRKFGAPHYRLNKSARLVNSLAPARECDLLDVGCGPATLHRLLKPNIHYYGIDLAIIDPAPNLIEADIVQTPIRFGEKRFDIVIAQGLFEYLGGVQSQKFAEVAQILREDGTFVVSYINFGHRRRHIYHAYSNVQPLEDFRQSLAQHFVVRKSFPACHNWNHGQPTRRLVKAANMYLSPNIPFISPILAVEYFFVCDARRSTTAAPNSATRTAN